MNKGDFPKSNLTEKLGNSQMKCLSNDGFYWHTQQRPHKIHGRDKRFHCIVLNCIL